MTQEQIIRRMLEGFIGDPPDSESQEGFLAAVIMIAEEVMGFEWDDPLLVKARAISLTASAVAEKVRPMLTVIDGDKL